MNLGGGRLGFWFRPTDRSITKSKNVLIVYDLNSVHPGQYTMDVNPATIASIISAQEISLGFTPATITSYADFNALPANQIDTYAHIWDVGYDTLITSPTATQYQTYLQSGGALFLLGENGYFADRDGTITNFITDMGGGGIAVNNGHYFGQAVIQPEFLLGNPNQLVDFYDVANFTSMGSGTPMVITNGQQGGVDPNIFGSAGPAGLNVAVVWETGSLSQARTGAICSILDVNWVDGSGRTQQNLIDNISIVLNKK
jgi:hypothetical protein